MIKYISLLIWFKWRFIDFINIIKIFGFANINIYQMDIWNLEKSKNIGKANFPWKKKYCGLHEEDIYLDVFFVKELNLVFRSHKKTIIMDIIGEMESFKMMMKIKNF